MLLLVVATLTTAAAAAAPSYAESAQDAVLKAAVERAPVSSQGTGLQATLQVTGRPSTKALRTAVHRALQGLARVAYPSSVTQLSIVQRVVTGVGAPSVALVDRDGFCRQVRIVAGRCVREADRTGVVVERDLAQKRGLHVGSRFGVQPVSGAGAATVLVVRGVAVRRDPQSGYWFGGDADPPPGAVALWAPQSYFSALQVRDSDFVQAAVDLPLDPRAVHLQDVTTLTDAVDFAARTIETGRDRPTVTYGIGQVLSAGVASTQRLLLPIVVAVAELLALGWYLLHSLMAGAADARGSEVALTKVRGLTGGRTLLLVVLEPALLLGLAVPVGVLLATLVEHTLARQALGADVDVRIGWPSWAAAVGAAAGGLVATAAASIAVLRRPVLEQWRNTARDATRRGPVVEAVIVVLAIAGVVQLRLSGALGPGSANGIALIAPMLILVAGALVGSRLVVLLARASGRLTRATGAVAAFVGLRQLGRRPAGRRTFAVLVVAVALALYALSSAAVTATNRDERALTEVGAPTVLHISPDGRTAQRLRTVDPSGRDVTAVSQVPVDANLSDTVDSSSMLVVDRRSFASVAYWRHDFGSASLPSLLQPLTGAPVSPLVTGTALALTVNGQKVPSSLTLHADLVDRSGGPVTADLGPLRSGTSDYRAPVACASGCDLRRVYVTQDRLSPTGLAAKFSFRDVRGLTGTRSTPVAPAATAVQWSGLNPLPDEVRPAETVAVTDGSVDITIAVRRPAPDGPGWGALAGSVLSVPALVTRDLSRDATFPVSVTTLDGVAAPLQVLGRVSVLPRLGTSGVVITRDWLAAASPSGTPRESANQIWVAGDAPADTVRRLRAAGVEVLSIDRATGRSTDLAARGPAFVAALTLATGVAAVLLGAAAVVLGLAQLARRRVFELSAMRALGIRRRSLFGSVLVEQAGLILSAAVVGLLLALFAVQLALPALPAYADQPTFPPFLVDQPIVLLLTAAGAIALVLLAAAAGTAVVLTRSASVSRLREAEQ